MDIRSQEKRIFDTWKSIRPSCVSDGVVDVDEYLASPLKLLFVLKEVNDLNGGSWDLRDFLRKGGRWQTWDNVTRWIEGIRHLPDEVAWEDLKNIDDKRRKAALCTVAVVNVKKTPGGDTSDTARLVEEAQEDSALLNQQLNVYGADLLICCGSVVGSIIKKRTDIGKKATWRMTARGTVFGRVSNGPTIILYSHPEARIAPNILHYGLMDAVQLGLGK